jgi:excisionase family DNA binding protein
MFALTNIFSVFIFGGMGKLLSTTQAAALLGVSVARVQTFIWEGRLTAIKIGRAYAIDEDDLKSVENRKTGRPPDTKAQTKAKAAKKGRKKG